MVPQSYLVAGSAHPGLKVPEGEVFTPTRALWFARENPQAVLLPVDVDNTFQPCGGFVRRAYGVAGRRFIGNVGARGCPLVLWCPEGHSLIHWAALASTEAGFNADGEAGEVVPSWKVQLIADTSNPMFTAIGVRQLEPPVSDQLVARGAVEVSLQQPGLLALALFVTSPGVSVMWNAVTQARPT